MKKNKILLIVALLLLCSCEDNIVEVKTDYLIKDKFDRVEYNFFLDIYQTKYYFVLEDYGNEKVSFDEYYQYDIGDYYTIISYEEIEVEDDE